MSDPSSAALPAGCVRLRSGDASADFALLGGELMSWRIGGRELVWHGDPAHWSRRAPILFPVVGASARGAVQVGGRAYPMPQHGFARDSAFTLEEHDETSLRLRLADSDETRAHYPFRFTLDVVAALSRDSLSIAFAVANAGSSDMPYGLGFHPAFPWPLDGSSREGHAVIFDRQEATQVPEVVAGGLLSRRTRAIAFDGRRLALDPALFTEALVFLKAKSRRFSFAAPSGASLSLALEDCPHLAVWSKPDAPFVSLEAWTGHADWEDAAGDLSARASMRHLRPGETARHAVTLAWHPAP